MAQTLVCDMSDLPPEVLAQIVQEEAAEAAAHTADKTASRTADEAARDASDTPEQAAAHTPEQAARDASNTPEQAASNTPKQTKRNALKRRQRAAAPDDELVSMNVRLTREAYDAVQALADEYGVSKAMVIRAALGGNMGDFFGGLRFPDGDDTTAIRDDIARIGDASTEIGHQLRRIGKNYNDALRLAHAEAKQGGKVSIPEMDPDLIDRAIARYEAAAERIGEMLWRILK